MKLPFFMIALSATLAVPSIVFADTSSDMSVGFENRTSRNSAGNAGNSSRELPPYLQCVPYAREVSGIQIYGDAHTWWNQAAGRYQRGREPKVGAVMAFQPHRNMKLGHIAAVSKIIDRRTVLISHSNWSPINGRRGQIERNVRAVDVSPNNDWSSVRVWYHPLQAVGKTAWPLHGFIYGGKAKGDTKFSPIRPQITQVKAPQAVTPNPSKKFSQAFASLGSPAAIAPPKIKTWSAPQPRRVAQTTTRSTQQRSDPVRAAIALYEQ